MEIKKDFLAMKEMLESAGIDHEIEVYEDSGESTIAISGRYPGARVSMTFNSDGRLLYVDNQE